MTAPSTLPDRETARADRGLFAYRVGSGALLGLAAGVPWAWALCGLLPAAAFGAAAAVLAAVLWRKPETRVSALLACAFGAVVGATLGRIGSFSWPGADALACFTLTGSGDGGGVGWTLLCVGGPAVTGSVTFGIVSVVARRRAREARAVLERDAGPLWFDGARVGLYASLLWSAANECLWPTWYGFIRDVCHPDIGPVAIVGYAFSAVGFVMARRAAHGRGAEVQALSRGEHATWIVDPTTRPSQASTAWVEGDGPPGSVQPHDHPQDWSAVRGRPREGAYRDRPGEIGFIYRDGARAADATRRRAIRAMTYLAVASVLCVAQAARTTNILVRQARWRAADPAGSGCVCNRGGRGLISGPVPLP